MTNFTVDKTKNKFLTKEIKDRISDLYERPDFKLFLRQLNEEIFWNYIKDEPNEVKASIALLLDEYTPGGIFYGLKSLPVRFYGCESVLTFDIPETFEKLEGLQLIGLTELKEITVSNYSPFFSSSDGVLYNKDQTHLVFCPVNWQKEELVLPYTVNEIDRYALCGNKHLKRIVFSECLAKIPWDAFDTCLSLESIEVPPDNQRFSSLDGVLFDKRMATLIKCPAKKSGKSFTVPKKTKTIAKYAFAGNQNIEEIVLGEGLRKIGMHAFSSCKNLKRIVLPDTVTEIARGAFAEDISLSSIRIPPKVKEIKIGAFSDCANLSDVIIPEGIEAIDTKAFRRCSSLTKIKLPKTLQSIQSYAFYRCTSLKSVSIPSGVKFILGSSFADCKALEAIEFEGTKEQWGQIKFYWRKINYRNSIKIIQCSDGVIYV